MKTFRINYILGVIFLALTLTSCEKEISLDLNPSDPRLVVEAVLQDGEYARVRLTKSKNYDEQNNYPPVTGAVITLSDNKGNSETLTFNPQEEVYQSANIKGKQGVSYYLSIDVEDKIYTSEAQLPYLVTIDSVYLYKFMTDIYYPMAVFQDRPNEKNFYRFIVTYNDIKMPTILLMDDKDRDGRKISRILFFNQEDDEEIKIKEGDRFSIEMRCIDEPIFDFYLAWNGITMNQANPPSNIEGGALGFFTAYSTNTTEFTVTKDDF